MNRPERPHIAEPFPPELTSLWKDLIKTSGVSDADSMSFLKTLETTVEASRKHAYARSQLRDALIDGWKTYLWNKNRLILEKNRTPNTPLSPADEALFNLFQELAEDVNKWYDKKY